MTIYHTGHLVILRLGEPDDGLDELLEHDLADVVLCVGPI